jgi:hypothetical protein
MHRQVKMYGWHSEAPPAWKVVERRSKQYGPAQTKQKWGLMLPRRKIETAIPVFRN